MDKQTKAALLTAYLGMFIFMAGTFIPLTARQIERQKVPLDDLGLWNYNVSTALCLLIVNLGLLEIGISWRTTMLTGYFFMFGSAAWFFREVSNTADRFSWVNIIVGLITLLLLIIQFKNRNK